MAFDATEEPNARTRLVRLRDFLAELPADRFDMSVLGEIVGQPHDDIRAGEMLTHCGTAGCIAGWACALFAPSTWTERADDVAAPLLGLRTGQGEDLFYPGTLAKPAWHATPHQAARVLTHLIETGQVDWSVAFADTPEPVS